MKRLMMTAAAVGASALLGLGGCTDGAGDAIDPTEMTKVGEVSDRYQSYNIEMVEVVGGDFWRPYSQMERDADGHIVFPEIGEGYDVSKKDSPMYMKLDPIDLTNPRIRALARGLAPAYVRVSGTWANAIYFQDDGEEALPAPYGFVNVLTARQWSGVLDFAQAVDAELVTSFAVSRGVRDDQGLWTPVEAQKIIDFTESRGGRIAAAELFNEPTMPTAGGEMEEGYDAESYARDMKVFYTWAKAVAPKMIILAPGTVGEGIKGVDFQETGMDVLSAEELLSADPRPQFDAFSFHHYGGASMRMFRNEEPFSITKERALSPEWLTRTDDALEHYKELRDRFAPDAKLWNTETAEAAAGGDPFATTYRDTFRYLYQLASNARHGLYVHIHNTLIASEYSLIDQTTLTPKPNYWAAYLWSHLMGTTVLDAGESGTKGVHLFAHSTKGVDGGVTLLVINTTDREQHLDLALPSTQYQLTAENLDATSIALNGKALSVGSDNVLPTLEGVAVEGGDVTLPAHSSTFFTFAPQAK